MHQRGQHLAGRAHQGDGAQPQHHRRPGRRARVARRGGQRRRRSAPRGVPAGPRRACGSRPTDRSSSRSTSASTGSWWPGSGSAARCASGPRRSSRGSEAWQVGSTVAGLVRQVVRGAHHLAPLVGIGISVPGMVRRSDGLIRLAPNLEWHDVSFGGIVLAALGVDVPVSLGNDADLGAAGRAPAGRRRRRRRPHLHLGQRRRRRRRHHRWAPAGGRGRLRRRDRAPALQPGRQALPLRQPAAAGRPRSARTPSPRRSSCPPDKVPQLGEVLDGYDEGAAGAARHRRPPSARGWRASSTSSTRRSSCWAATSAPLYTLVRAEVDAGPGRPGPAGRPRVGVPDAARPGPRLGAARRGRDGLRAALRRPGRRARQRDPVDVRARLAG